MNKYDDFLREVIDLFASDVFLTYREAFKKILLKERPDLYDKVIKRAPPPNEDWVLAARLRKLWYKKV